MNEQQTLIWNKLSHFDFNDGPSIFSFSDRLAKENNWSVQKTFRAIEAYRRFLLLAATAGHPVSPPAIVDEVWHLHLLYTRNYWQKLCRDTLGTDLHHEPTRGGQQETAKFGDWYARTLQSYRDTFQEEPPADFWPAPGSTNEKHDYRRIDMNGHLVLPKSRFVQLLVIAAIAITLLAFAGGWSAPVAAVDNPLEYKGGDFLSLYIFVAVLAFAVAIALRWQARRGSTDTNIDRQLDPYAVAYLSESSSLAVRAAIANLIATQRLTLDVNGMVERTSTTHETGLHPLEEAILTVASTPLTPNTIARRVKPQLDRIEAELAESRLVVGSADRNMAALGNLLIGGTLLFGVIKCVMGFSRGKPVSYLVMLMVAIVIGWIIVASRSLHRTRAGDAALARLRNQHRRDEVNAAPTHATASHQHDPANNSPPLAYGGMMGFHPATMLFALYGPSILMGYPELSHAHQTLAAPPPSSISGDSGGSSCGSDGGGDSGGDSGGSSCSSGCGGCGGGGD